MTFDIIHKQNFTNQLLIIPRDRVIQVLQKIETLRENPMPDGHIKKKLSSPT